MKKNVGILGTLGVLAITIALVLQAGTARAAALAVGNSTLANGTDHFGPFASTSPDGGSCGSPWANDTFDREFMVHDNGDGTFKVTEEFKNGSFTTTGPVSPGKCSTSSNHGSIVAAGVAGSFQGFLSGTVTSTTYTPSGCTPTPTTCDTTQGFLTAVFGLAPFSSAFTCNAGFAGCTFNFEYQSSDQSLQFHHWQDKSDNHGGEQFIGDIANS